jgi:hypothetical protein
VEIQANISINSILDKMNAEFLSKLLTVIGFDWV